MEEGRIRSFIGVWSSLIMSNTSNGGVTEWIWIGFAIAYLVRYLYLTARN